MIETHGLSGVLVEPQPTVFERLVDDYRGRHFANVAIGPRTGTLPLHVFVDEQDGQPLDVFASFDRSRFVTWKAKLGIAAEIVTVDVWTVAPCELADEYGFDRFDLFIIDTEGYDYEVIKLIDLDRHKPRVVQFEDVHLTRTSSWSIIWASHAAVTGSRAPRRIRSRSGWTHDDTTELHGESSDPDEGVIDGR